MEKLQNTDKKKWNNPRNYCTSYGGLPRAHHTHTSATSGSVSHAYAGGSCTEYEYEYCMLENEPITVVITI